MLYHAVWCLLLYIYKMLWIFLWKTVEKLVDNFVETRRPFVSPYLERRLRSLDEVMRARERSPAGLASHDPKSRDHGSDQDPPRLRLVYSRPIRETAPPPR